ncbi:MAG: VWA domain-containing protein [Alphaproteobacteria bacterium]
MTKRDVTKSGASDVARFLEQVEKTPARAGRGRRGRLVFAMDATASREPSWDRAVQVQGQMFLETQAKGGLDVQLVYFRGFDECRASKWVREPRALVGLMTKVMCRAGRTQIERVLNHALRQAKEAPLDALVYVGDCCEEDVDHLGQLAGQLGARGARAFVFQEGDDPVASRAFRDIAKLTGGAHCRLGSTSPDELRQLLGAVAAYAAGGVAALEDANRRQQHRIQLLSRS